MLMLVQMTVSDEDIITECGGFLSERKGTPVDGCR
jgi:hypothetical protein